MARSVGLVTLVLALVLALPLTGARAAVPVQLIAPTIDGVLSEDYLNEEIGEPLTCLPGSWQSDSPVVVTMAWTIGKAVVDTGETHDLQLDDLVGSALLSCTVTATNSDGSSSATVPVDDLDTSEYPLSGVTLPRSLIITADRLGRINLPATCNRVASTDCTGRIKLTVGTRNIAVAAVKIAAGSHGHLTLQLTRYGMQLTRAHPLESGFLKITTMDDGPGVTIEDVAIDGQRVGGSS